MSSVTGRCSGQMLKSKDDMKCCFQHQKIVYRDWWNWAWQTFGKKHWKTWCPEWISYYCIAHSIFLFTNTPTSPAVAANKGKHRLQETLPRVRLLCSILKAPWFVLIGFPGIAPGTFSGRGEPGSWEKQGSLKAAPHLTSFGRSKLQGPREHGVSLALID